ncbi:ABC transporter permease [Isoptericola sp. NPDC019482]|uniref:ABC transporter permease n=1 Tax=Isoptericola sp. NPDC019482 TaxID=3154688 RepID=UPI003475D1C1
MTAVDTPARPAGAAGLPTLRGTTAPPLGRLVGVELRKLRDTRAGAWLLVTIALVVLGIIGLGTLWGVNATASFGSFVSVQVMPLQLLVPMVAVLAVTGEWSQRGALTTFALVPRRGRVVAAKALAVLLVTLAVAAVGVAVAAAGIVVGSALHDVPAAWDLTAEQAGRFLLITVLSAAVGFALGVLIRSSAPALVAYLGFVLIVPMLSAIAGSYVAWWAAHGLWLDLATTLQAFAAPQVTGEAWAQLGTSTLLWVGVPLAFGLRGLLRTEIR